MVMNMGRLSFSDGSAVFAAGPPVSARFRDGYAVNPQVCGQFLFNKKTVYIFRRLLPRFGLSG